MRASRKDLGLTALVLVPPLLILGFWAGVELVGYLWMRFVEWAMADWQF